MKTKVQDHSKGQTAPTTKAARTPETKGLRIEVKDAGLGTVIAVFSTFNVKDHDDDVTLPGAFEDGAEVLISAYGHATWGGAKPVGRGTIHTDGTKAWLDGQFFLDTIDGADTFKTIKGTGDLQEWSYGFNVIETGEVTEAMRQSGVWRVLTKVAVFEVSPVMLGAGVGTGTLSVKSAQRKDAGADDPMGDDDTTEPSGGADGNVDVLTEQATAEHDAERTATEDAAKALRADAMSEFARFAKTRARLAGAHAA